MAFTTSSGRNEPLAPVAASAPVPDGALGTLAGRAGDGDRDGDGYGQGGGLTAAQNAQMSVLAPAGMN